jgi:acid phosphatase
VDITNLRLNETYPGPMAAGEYAKFSPVWPIPATSGNCSAGHGILDIVKKNYANSEPTYNYTSPFPVDYKNDYNTKVTATRKSSNTTSSASGTATTKTGAAVAATVPCTAMTGAMVALFAYLI